MTGFDLAVIGIVLISMLLGLWRGLIYEVMALLGWPLAFVISRLVVDDLVPLIPSVADASSTSAQVLSLTVVMYVLVFIIVLIAWAMLSRMLSRMMKDAGAGWSDRMMGGFFGILRGGLVLLVLVWIVGLTNFIDYPLWRDSVARKPLEDAALLTKAWLPEVIAQRISYEIRS